MVTFYLRSKITTEDFPHCTDRNLFFSCFFFRLLKGLEGLGTKKDLKK